MVYASYVFDFGADEAGGALGGVGGGGEGVAVVGGFVEVFREAFVVELFLLAGFEEGFEGGGVGFHVAEAAEVVLIGVFF